MIQTTCFPVNMLTCALQEKFFEHILLEICKIVSF